MIIDGWAVATGVGIGLTAIGKIGGDISRRNRQNEMYKDMLTDMRDSFVNKYNLDSTNEEDPQ